METTLFDEALGWRLGSTGPSSCSSSSFLIKDTVASPASFILTLLLKRILGPVASAPSSSLSANSSKQQPQLVIFLGLSEPFSHYSRIARKQGVNLVAFRNNGAFVFLDLLSVANAFGQKELGVADHHPLPGSTHVPRNENKLLKLYCDVVTLLKKEPERKAWILIDDLSLLEVVAEGNKNHVLDFVHYCRALSCKHNCSLVMLAHGDVYLSTEELVVVNQLELWSDTVISVQPLATGYCTDVHGQVDHIRIVLSFGAGGWGGWGAIDTGNTIVRVVIQHCTPLNAHYGVDLNKRFASELASLCRLHYKVMENTVAFVMPGKAALS